MKIITIAPDQTVFIGEKEPASLKPDYTFPSLYEAVAGLIEQGILQMKSTL